MGGRREAERRREEGEERGEVKRGRGGGEWKAGEEKK